MPGQISVLICHNVNPKLNPMGKKKWVDLDRISGNDFSTFAKFIFQCVWFLVLDGAAGRWDFAISILADKNPNKSHWNLFAACFRISLVNRDLFFLEKYQEALYMKIPITLFIKKFEMVLGNPIFLKLINLDWIKMFPKIMSSAKNGFYYKVHSL